MNLIPSDKIKGETDKGMVKNTVELGKELADSQVAVERKKIRWVVYLILYHKS